ncbi:hypothetical protein [Pontiella sulfatireligans]|uniref:Uncharacterized protein n=1 Tax=Pontiella sulfatireligans TaxID=2750658 RepID=A0A6C2UNS6_9BACT|nr:hypothetical protein [Pontiella sulfatireligans]VGO21719.1 hypothetical protein SCARR_03793 [Pontiella sulfatireligans]
MDNEFTDMGKELVEQSKEVSTARGIMDELFPYIYVASRRMSLRAISRWLEENKNVKISHVSISKALKDSESYFIKVLEEIVPPARFLADQGEISIETILFDADALDYVIQTKFRQQPEPNDKAGWTLYYEGDTAGYILENCWFNLPEEFRAECKRFGQIINEEDYDEEGFVRLNHNSEASENEVEHAE